MTFVQIDDISFSDVFNLLQMTSNIIGKLLTLVTDFFSKSLRTGSGEGGAEADVTINNGRFSLDDFGESSSSSASFSSTFLYTGPASLDWK